MTSFLIFVSLQTDNGPCRRGACVCKVLIRSVLIGCVREKQGKRVSQKKKLNTYKILMCIILFFISLIETQIWTYPTELNLMTSFGCPHLWFVQRVEKTWLCSHWLLLKKQLSNQSFAGRTNDGDNMFLQSLQVVLRSH